MALSSRTQQSRTTSTRKTAGKTARRSTPRLAPSVHKGTASARITSRKGSMSLWRPGIFSEGIFSRRSKSSSSYSSFKRTYFILSLALSFFLSPKIAVADASGALPPTSPSTGSGTGSISVSTSGKNFNDSNAAQLDTQISDRCSTAFQPGANPSNQFVAHCLAAKSQLEAARANDIVWQIWAADAGVCGSICLASMAASAAGVAAPGWVSKAASAICLGTTLSALGVDIAKTHEYSQLMMALGPMMMVGPMFASSSKNSANPNADSSAKVAKGNAAKADVAADGAAADGAATKGETAIKAQKAAVNKPMKTDMAACGEAALAGFMAYSRKSGIDPTFQNALTELNSALNLIPNPIGMISGGVTQALAPVASGLDSAAGAIKSAVGVGSTTSSATPNTCNSISTSCAVAIDSNLPSTVNTPQFAEAFKASSGGQDLNSFAQAASSPGQAISGAMAGGLTPEAATTLAQGLVQFSQGIPPYDKDKFATYASGGGALPNSGGGDDMAGMMEKMMSQFAPKGDGKDPTQDRATEIEIANRTRQPASIAEDRTLSIFDRVTYRYFHLGTRLQ